MTMSNWSIAEAKARFSELVLHVRERPQRVTKRGRDVAVVLAPEEYDRLVKASAAAERQPMATFLRAAEALRAGEDLGLHLPKRRRTRGRGEPFGSR